MSKNLNRYFLLQGVELLAVGSETVRKAQQRLQSCERCNLFASAPFYVLLDEATGRSNPTECMLCEAARCPKCGGPVIETTLVSFDDDADGSSRVDHFDAPWEQNIVMIDEPT